MIGKSGHDALAGCPQEPDGFLLSFSGQETLPFVRVRHALSEESYWETMID